MKRYRTDYTLEFKQEGVRLVLAGQRQALDEIMHWLTNHERLHSTLGLCQPRSCATTGCSTASSSPTTTSSITAASPGAASPINHGASCPSDYANGPMGDSQRDSVSEPWLLRGCRAAFAQLEWMYPILSDDRACSRFATVSFFWGRLSQI